MGITQNTGASSQLKPGVIDNAAARPASPFEGQMVYEKDTDLILVYNGSAWVCLTPQSAYASNQISTSSTSYVTLTSDPSVSISTGTKALVTIAVRHVLSGAAGYIQTGYAVSGATTLAATDLLSAQNYFGTGDSGNDRSASFTYLQTGLTAGVNTFQMKQRTGAGTMYVTQRSITVVGIP